MALHKEMFGNQGYIVDKKANYGAQSEPKVKAEQSSSKAKVHVDDEFDSKSKIYRGKEYLGYMDFSLMFKSLTGKVQ